MPFQKLSDEKQREIRRRVENGESFLSIAIDMRISRNTVHKYAGRRPDAPPKRPETGTRVTGDTAETSVLTTHPVRTEAEAVKAAGVDLTVWYVDRWEATLWTTGMKLGRRGFDRAVQQQQYLVRLKLKRLQPRSHEKALAALWDRMKAHAPKYPAAPRPAGTGEAYLAVFGLVDVHFGRLCWGPEAGVNYDLRIAERVYEAAVADLLQQCKGRRVGRFVLPVGNDLIHVDSPRNTTYAGTPQDVDGRFPKVMVAAEMAVVRAVERMAGVAPVDVLWVPGNHDPNASFHLMRTVAAWFRACKHVRVDASPAYRKYVRFGRSLVGFTHGDQEKPESLPTIMAQERPADWAATSCREWLRAHDHRPRKWTTKATDTYEGVTVRGLPSPAPADFWHAKRGYIGVTPAVECYFYGETRGYAGSVPAIARLD